MSAAAGVAAAEPPAKGERWRRLRRRLGPWAPLLVLIALCILIGLINPNFLSLRNLVRIANSAAIPLILGLGVTFVIIMGSIDLSIEGVVAFGAVVLSLVVLNGANANGIGFERKLNENGSYWEPDQYPRTVWVPAKSKTLDPALLSGYDSPIPEYSYDDSLDNYKLFKNQRGEAVARYVGPNSRNGPPKKAIWVPKKTIEALPVTGLLTMQEENARYILEKIRQNDYMLVSPNHYTHSSRRNFNAYSFDYSRTQSSYNSYDYQKKSYPACSCVSKPPTMMWVVKKA
jgi:hypothetical protein